MASAFEITQGPRLTDESQEVNRGVVLDHLVQAGYARTYLGEVVHIFDLYHLLERVSDDELQIRVG